MQNVVSFYISVNSLSRMFIFRFYMYILLKLDHYVSTNKINYGIIIVFKYSTWMLMNWSYSLNSRNKAHILLIFPCYLAVKYVVSYLKSRDGARLTPVHMHLGKNQQEPRSEQPTPTPALRSRRRPSPQHLLSSFPTRRNNLSRFLLSTNYE